MDITLQLNGKSLSDRVLTYSVMREVTYQNVITTLDGTEHPYSGALRPILSFTLLPGTDDEDAALYEVLRNLILDVTYTEDGVDVTRRMRVVSNLESVFLLKSVDGKRRYKSGTIQLRGTESV